MQDISSSKIPSIMELQKLKEWKKSLLSILQLMDEALVKEFLLGVGYCQTDVRKYKTLRAWQHKQGIHSVKVCSLPKYPTMWALRGCCNPSFSTDPEETKIVYIVLEKDTSKPVYAYCSCTVGLRGDCSHAGALLFVLCDIVSQGKTTLPADPTCTELPCSWSNPKGTSVDPIRIEQIHFYKSRFGEQPPAKKFSATPTVSEQFFGVSRSDIMSAPCQKTPEENTTLLPVISPAEQCKSSKESRVPLVPVTLCENGTFEENRFQAPITYPVQIPSIPPLSDSAFEFYNNNVKVSIQQCWEIEKETRPQSSSELWFKQRKLRLTASNFGNIIKRKKADVSKLVNRLSTTCDSLSHLKAIRFGKENEDVASQLYMQYQNSHGSPGTKVFHCGLVITSNPHFPWLGASPDRLVYDPNARPSTGGLEVKCIESAQGMTPFEAFKSKQTPKEGKKKSFCLKMKDGHLQLNENHNYFYQVQGQEGVSGIKWFDFALLTDPRLGLNGLFVQRIHFEKNKWESEWLPKLTDFYFNHLLPVIIKDNSSL
ncbi:uncharacterized protein [Montipora foliosa]|uniref:uncharacterized protein isoform X2 n=1 Tax=Montipora foliosa TaxID=591990 RepID=UPI0035F21ACE